MKELLLVMCAESTANMIAVSYGDREKEKQTLAYKWILFPGKTKMTVTLANGLQFQFWFPEYGNFHLEHQGQKRLHVQGICGGSLNIDQLHDETHNPRGSLPGAPYKKIYTKFAKLGNGAFGSVYDVREASTGKVFAIGATYPLAFRTP